MTLLELHGALDHILKTEQLRARHAEVVISVDDTTDPEGPMELIGSVDVLVADEDRRVHQILLHARHPR